MAGDHICKSDHFCKMNDLCCTKCGKSFKYLSHFNRHQDRKQSCVLILELNDLSKEEKEKPYICNFCGRRYSTYTNMRRHVRKTCKIAPNEKNGKEGTEFLYEHVKRQQEQNTRLEGEMKELRTQVSQLVNLLTTREGQNIAGKVAQAGNEEIAIQGDNNTTTQSHLEQHNNTTINIFGQEDVSHINHMTVYKILNRIYPYFETPDAARALLSEMLSEIYGNVEHPENHTCFKPNKKTSDTMIHGPKGWEFQTTQRTYQPMVQKSMDVLLKFSNQPLPSRPGCEDMKPRDKFEKIYKFLVDNEKTFPTEMKEDICVILLQLRGLLRKNNGGKLPAPGDE